LTLGLRFDRGLRVVERSLLERVPLFAGLAPDELRELSSRLRTRRYARGETLCLEGDPGTSLYIIEKGRVKLGLTSSEGREIILDLLGPGDVFGELALLDGAPRSANAVAVEASEVLLLARDEFLRFLEQHPQLALVLLSTLSHWLRRLTTQMQDTAFLDVPARLARAILRLAEAEEPTEGQPVTPRLTQTDLAGMVGTTRETLNRWLGFYEDQGLIRRDRHQIVVLRPDKLRGRVYQ
jgi:CRP/FNR family transcriptional regulator, cyclic AMP receptor protein